MKDKHKITTRNDLDTALFTVMKQSDITNWNAVYSALLEYSPLPDDIYKIGKPILTALAEWRQSLPMRESVLGEFND